MLGMLRYADKLQLLHLAPSSLQAGIRQHTSAYVSIRQHTSAYVSIRQHTHLLVGWLAQDDEDVPSRMLTSADVC